MKKILSLLVTFIVAVSMSAQTQTGNKMEVKLDSVVTTKQSGGTTSKSKEEYTYDDQGNQTSYIFSRWTAGAWVNSDKYEYTYDAQGNKTSDIISIWTAGAWVNSYKTEYTYDDQGNQTSYIISIWTAGAWVNSSKSEYTYDDQGNQTSDIISIWTAGAWVNSYKYEYTYDAQGNQTSEIYSNWTAGAWVNYSKIEYAYDNQGNKTSSILSYWTAGAWVNSYKYEYTYDDQGNRTSSINSNWTAGAWVNNIKYECTYDNQGNKTSEIYSKWTAGAWVNSSKTEYTYDDQGNKTSYIYSKWTAGAWVESYRTSYDNYYKPSKLTFATPSMTMDALAEQEVKVNLSKEGWPLSSLQMNITLPDGISYVDGSAALGTMADDAELGIQKAEGQNKYTVTILPKATSGSQKEFGTDGEILSFKIKADAALTDTIRITNVIGSTPTAETAMSLPDVKTPVMTAVTVEENKSATVDTKTTVKDGDASTTSIQSQIASTTTVSGVLLTTTGSNPGTQAVIDAVKASYLTSQNFKTALADATEVKINVDVQVTPSDYNDGATQGEGKMTYDLKPVATVTAGTETATTDVTNDMIDQLQDIKVNIYTGFKPSAIKHINSSDGKLMEIFTEGNGLTWNEGTKVATVTVHHFSKLIVNQESTDQIAVDGVIAKINSIGTVEYTPACKARIDAARTAYDALTEPQQTLVKNTNYRILTDAEKKYQELTPTSINEVNTTTSAQAQGKYFRAGKLIIVKDGKSYNAAGQQVK